MPAATVEVLRQRRTRVDRVNRDAVPSHSGGPVSQEKIKQIATLAASLLDWRVALEGQLRILTSVQRHLERVRVGTSTVGESDLLLSEVQRQIDEMRKSSEDLHCWPDIAATQAALLRKLQAI